jgi:hypothetical protein
MGGISKGAIFLAMVILTLVSMWTTYASLQDSILPEPVVAIPLTESFTWNCSIFALGLSVAIGLMLFALKLAIIDEQKKLNFMGIVGLTIVAFISITFNMDVLYRVGNQDFFLRHSTAKVKSSYGTYLGEVRTQLLEKKQSAERSLARQEGELESEIRGLREAPAGYGQRARSEDHRLTVLAKEVAVEITAIDEALAEQAAADTLLSESRPASIAEIEVLQDTLRVEAKNVGALAGVPLPAPVSLENPFFAVFERLFDLETVGWKEIFFLILAFLIDLGDIIGYSLVPAAVASSKPQDPFDVTRLPTRLPNRGPERIPEEYLPFPNIDPVEQLEAPESTTTAAQKTTTTPEPDPSSDTHALSFKRRGTSQFRL